MLAYAKQLGFRSVIFNRARIIHEDFYCNRRYEDQNSLRYSFFAPGSYKGRSTSQAR
jgi:hypothetical protein